MGLDITAYRQIEKLGGNLYNRYGEPVDADGTEIEYDLIAYVNGSFPGRNGSVEDGAVYLSKESTGFRAGGYGGYNAWRDNLARVAGWPLGSYEQYGRSWESYAASAWEASEGPFWELINFSDCEGVIGPEISKKLAADFAAFDDKAKAEPGPFYALYQKWREAFEMASDNGAVRFH